MDYKFSNNILSTKKSFIREILKLTVSPDIISFAGGLPNKDLFPVDEIKNATINALEKDGKNILQYSTTEGYLPLREFIAERYKKVGLDANPDNIIITSGSQQALDLTAKCFMNPGDGIALENPGYLGAIQAFTIFNSKFYTATLEDDGINCQELEKILQTHKPKIFYLTPNFQNPTGLTYSDEKRKKVAELAKKYDTIILEDDPYGELRFIGKKLPPIKTYAGENGILMGSFSKIVAPGFRLGWVYAPKSIIDKFVTAKQAADLHTNTFSQRVLYQYLLDNGVDGHIEKIKSAYLKQRNTMVENIKKYIPKEVKFTEPEGGMFLWGTLPEGWSALELFNVALEKKVAFVPGEPFYTDGRIANTFRLNYTNSDQAGIEKGVKSLAEAIEIFRKNK